MLLVLSHEKTTCPSFLTVFISERIINRTCLEFDDQCMILRDSPGNSLRQCVVCGWDLCNRAAKKLAKMNLYLVLFIVLRLFF